MLKFPDILICTNQLIYTDNCYKDIFKTKKKTQKYFKGNSGADEIQPSEK